MALQLGPETRSQKELREAIQTVADLLIEEERLKAKNTAKSLARELVIGFSDMAPGYYEKFIREEISVEEYREACFKRADALMYEILEEAEKIYDKGATCLLNPY